MSRRPSLAAGALLAGVLSAALTGCSGDSSPSADAPAAGAPSGAASAGTSGGASPAAVPSDAGDFCAAYAVTLKAGTDLPKQKEAIAKLAAVKVPASMDEDAKAGLGLLISAIQSSQTRADLEKQGQGLSSEQTGRLLAFSQYLTVACPDQLGAAASSSPSASPTS
ncbi:hypothetical protein K8Z61_14110 [Nocardioides sp. TRM66260-LWL]|uniref:hypothetical protein n=1 Tax=Nocardioides sp. TRM66260-LWL TaxID=2874478 RepID=UPI001CC3C5CA|nr:hypothetical protein [Nocardioides sp. TRM66260-LWL]MBZ5735627.1 hypothetical protein [Nocardioides sp. TRM66260-LWL]